MRVSSVSARLRAAFVLFILDRQLIKTFENWRENEQ